MKTYTLEEVLDDIRTNINFTFDIKRNNNIPYYIPFIKFYSYIYIN